MLNYLVELWRTGLSYGTDTLNPKVDNPTFLLQLTKQVQNTQFKLKLNQ